LSAQSAQRTWTISISGASSGGSLQTQGSAFETFHGLDFGVGVSGDVAYDSLTYSVQTYIRDTRVDVSHEIGLRATDTPLLLAGAGAVAFGNHFGIGGALARNGLNSLISAYTQDATLRTTDVVLQATTQNSVVAFSDGGSGTKASIAVAGSVNMN